MPEPYEVNVLQNADELDRFVALAKSNSVRSYLEIGAKFGGTLWRIGSVLPAGSKIVAVDLPNGTRAWNESGPSLQACVQKLRNLGHTVTLIWGDSTDQKVIDTVKSLGDFDLTFIDANHTLPYVTKDWENYGPLSRMVAFHDIGWRRDATFQGVGIEVPRLWEQIKAAHRHEEIKLDAKAKDNGIGVLWRW